MPFDSIEKKRAYNRQYHSQPHVLEKKRIYFKKWRDENADHVRAKEAKRRLEKRGLCLIATTRTRARKKGLEFNLEPYADEIQKRIDKGFCELTGEPFDLSPGRRHNSPSLDRIDCSKGYTYDNVRIVLHLMNQALGEWGEDVLFEVMSKWTAMRSMASKRRSSLKRQKK